MGIIVNLIIYVFYIFCMVCLLHGERIKQPLKLFLSSLIVSTIVCLLAVFGVFFSQEKKMNMTGSLTFLLCSHLAVCPSAFPPLSVCLNFFYCTHIVPANRALSIWIKRNIKPIIFCILIVENI
ncbi:hypothetical protein CRENBAI_001200 [Crenichthys baileyi]|uniref:Uncharacterized protein n=1 Tax=Crenichthys baileyi TaxID=28760 RepID=A0AAV9QRK1_9TELE